MSFIKESEFTNPDKIDDGHRLPPVAPTPSPVRREIIANRIASWFDRGARGGVRIIDIAAQMRIPLSYLHEYRTQELLDARGIGLVQYPDVRYVFAYRKLDGEPDGKALVARWSRHAIESAPGSLKTGTSDGRHSTLRRSTAELCSAIRDFLAANAPREYGFVAIDRAVGPFSDATLKRDKTQSMLRELGVQIRVTGTPGENGSRRFYSVPK